MFESGVNGVIDSLDMGLLAGYTVKIHTMAGRTIFRGQRDVTHVQWKGGILANSQELTSL